MACRPIARTISLSCSLKFSSRQCRKRLTPRRQFSGSSILRTDGVYGDLTIMRVKVPWVEALRQQTQDKGNAALGVAPGSTRELKPKRMADSLHKVIIPLASDPWLGDNYLNANGRIRLGTLLMDLDALAGVSAYKHTGDNVTTVTAAVDRITINKPWRHLQDLELSGRVTYATGRSSMEVSLQVATAPQKGAEVKPDDVLLTCAFTMVSLDPNTKKPVPVNPLLPETQEEKRLFALGEKNSVEKKALAKTALRKQTPNDEESDLIHAMWLKQLEYHDPNNVSRKPDNLRWMSQTVMQTTAIMQPQYRNRHNFMIFGGFLLKQTFELAFSCCAAFSHARPHFVSLDPSNFDNPVPVGSVLYLTATVSYTDPPLIKASDLHHDGSAPQPSNEASNFTRVQVRVDSKVRDVEHGETKPTGQFNYTFLVDKDIKIMPQTYSEFMIWIDARRRVERVEASMDDSLSDEMRLGKGSENKAHE